MESIKKLEEYLKYIENITEDEYWILYLKTRMSEPFPMTYDTYMKWKEDFKFRNDISYFLTKNNVNDLKDILKMTI